jgi:cation transport ATPase
VFEGFWFARSLKTIVFDKTGTLTKGRLKVLGMDTANGSPLPPQTTGIDMD